jgi:hypothetical protein
VENPVKAFEISQTPYPYHSKADKTSNRVSYLPPSTCYTGISEKQKPVHLSRGGLFAANPFIINILPITPLDAIF